jgi:precorrin-6A synthase
MRKLFAIGIGVGNPEHVTLQAIEALNRVDVFFAADKGALKADLLALRKHICERFIREREYRFVEAPDPVRDVEIAGYSERVAAWHRERSQLWAALIERELGEDQAGAFLVWGDPSLYDSTLRILHGLAGSAFELHVIPGISSVSALAASHRIPLHRVGGSLHITTGRRLAADAQHNDDLVVMLDGEQAWTQLDPNAFEMFWGAYLGTPHEMLRHGVLADVSADIQRIRAEARAQRGWIFDIYYLRRIAR